MNTLIHPALLEKLYQFYDSLCSITHYTSENQDTYGEPQPAWVNLGNHINLPCSIAPSGGREVHTTDMTVAVSSHIISIAGYYPAITPIMRAVIDSVSYDILSVGLDSKKKTTQLVCQVVL